MRFAHCTLGFLIFLSSAVSQAACYEPLKAKLPSAGIVVFGELHGTNEIPQFFLACIKEFIARKESVDVFLEMDVRNNAALNSYANGHIDEAALLQTPHWKKVDGRASQAMLALVRALRDLPGGPVAAHGFDASGGQRDQDMMKNLVAQRGKQRYALVLTGNVHARLTRGATWNADFVPFAKYLVDQGEQVVSLNARYTGGTAWVCAPACGVTPLVGPGPLDAVVANGVVLQSDDPDYAGYFMVGTLSASPPPNAR